MSNGWILVTGGAGYIGSHTCVELLHSGCQLVVVDNFSNSKRQVLKRVERIAGRTLHFVEADIRDQAHLLSVFNAYDVQAVIHFAGLKAVGESVENPLHYYSNNVSGTLTLLNAMSLAGIRTIVFSSSATVYGTPHTVPISEDFPLGATNPYGRSKQMVEEMLRDLYQSDSRWRIALLRYFNPVGAHSSGLIGEDPNGIPNNLMPFICQVAVGKRPYLSVFGDDYPTHDGTGVRDYIHVVDLAKGHLKALETLSTLPYNDGRLLTLNLGTGKGYSVLEMIHAFQGVSGRPIQFKVTARRPGDVAACFADPSRAVAEIGWKANLDLTAMCQDAWNWQHQNPSGYTE